MESLTSHYQQLLGLPSNWKVDNVDLSLPHKRVTIKLKYVGQDVTCPECESSCSIYDHAPEQRWRHLDTMQFETILVARLPRVNCKEHGVKTSSAPWADKHSRFTLMFEGFGEGPYYAVELSPSMLNTQGGPRRNEHAEIIRPNGKPIGRLYSAGELGSIYSYLYQGTGNIGECLAFGRIAGRNAAAEQDWTAAG